MRRFFVLAVLTLVSAVGLVAVAGCGGGNSGSEAPEYTIVKVQDANVGVLARRIAYSVQLPDRYTEEEARAIAEDIIETRHKGSNGLKVNALTFWFFFPGTDLSTGADGAIVWAPDGDWAKADTVRAGDYSSFQFYTRSYRR